MTTTKSWHVACGACSQRYTQTSVRAPQQCGACGDTAIVVVSALVAPMVHLNGTSGAELERQYSSAGLALDKAIDALALTAPHGRDYYRMEGDAYRRALAEHSARLDALKRVREELSRIVEAIDKRALEA